MIESRMYIKSLNATETGESNTNDSYILVPRGLDASDFFDMKSETKKRFNATDPITQKSYELRYEITGTKEQRIYNLGIFCRDKNIHAGDTICLERINVNSKVNYYIKHRSYNCIALLQKCKGYYIIERNDVGDELFGKQLNLSYNGINIELTLTFKMHGKKRNDSPENCNFYEAALSSGQKLSDINKSSFIILDMDSLVVREFIPTKEYRVIQQ